MVLLFLGLPIIFSTSYVFGLGTSQWSSLRADHDIPGVQTQGQSRNPTVEVLMTERIPVSMPGDWRNTLNQQFHWKMPPEPQNVGPLFRDTQTVLVKLVKYDAMP